MNRRTVLAAGAAFAFLAMSAGGARAQWCPPDPCVPVAAPAQGAWYEQRAYERVERSYSHPPRAAKRQVKKLVVQRAQRQVRRVHSHVRREARFEAAGASWRAGGGHLAAHFATLPICYD